MPLAYTTLCNSWLHFYTMHDNQTANIRKSEKAEDGKAEWQLGIIIKNSVKSEYLSLIQRTLIPVFTKQHPTAGGHVTARQ